MKTIAKMILYTLSIALLAWALPWLFHFLTAKPASTPFTLYSCVTGSFAYIDADKEKGPVYKDMNGKTYTEEEFDSILPFFYYRQLAAKDRLPDTINGVPVTAHAIRKNNFYAKQAPRDVNFTAPELHMLMESMPRHVDLEEPEDAFRLKDGRMTVLHMADNSIDEGKSDFFTGILLEKGFVFPVKAIHGNPTTRKEYDEGYILIDNDSQVFHLKQMRGRPYVRNAGVDTSLKMKHAMITEFSGRKTLAFLTDESDRLYVLTPEYRLHRLPVSYNPEKEGMLVIGDMLNWTVRISDDRGYSVYALDANTYEAVDSLRYDYPGMAADYATKAIFPFTLSFTDNGDKWVKPRIKDFSVLALALNALLGTVYLLVRRRETKTAVPYAAVILIFGIFAFIPFLIIKQ